MPLHTYVCTCIEPGLGKDLAKCGRMGLTWDTGGGIDTPLLPHLLAQSASTFGCNGLSTCTPLTFPDCRQWYNPWYKVALTDNDFHLAQACLRLQGAGLRGPAFPRWIA